MNAQDLPQHRLRALRIATRFDMARAAVVAIATIAGRNVEVVIVPRARAEAEPAAVMILRRLIEREHNDFAVRISDIGIARDVETGDMADAVTKRAAGCGVVDVKAAVGRVVRIKGEPEQTLLVAARLDPGVNVEKRCRIHRARGEINDENLTRLLDDENPAYVARRRGYVKRERESRGDSFGRDADCRLSVRRGERECRQRNGRRGRESPRNNRFRFRAHSPFYPSKHENVNPAIVSSFRERRPSGNES